jgi:hypothetical protein
MVTPPALAPEQMTSPSPTVSPAPVQMPTAQIPTAPAMAPVTPPVAENRSIPSAAPTQQAAPTRSAETATLPEPARTASRQPVREPSPAAVPAQQAAREPVTTDAKPFDELKAEEFAETLAIPPLPVQPVPSAEGTTQNVDQGIDTETILVGLAGLLGIGAIGGAIALGRRRKSRGSGDSVSAIATKPPVSPEPVRAESLRVEPETVMPAAMEAPRRWRPNESRRVGIVPGSLLADRIDYSKPAGYYAAIVDDGPTPLNPFLTRQNRLRRAHFLDRQLSRAASRREERPVSRPAVRELEHV